MHTDALELSVSKDQLVELWISFSKYCDAAQYTISILKLVYDLEDMYSQVR